MQEISLNILDIVQNSIKAGASLVEIGVVSKGNILTVTINDDGCGMDVPYLHLRFPANLCWSTYGNLPRGTCSRKYLLLH